METRSELRLSLQTIQALLPEYQASPTELLRDALLFRFLRTATLVRKLGTEICYEQRLGVPTNDSKLFAALSVSAILTQENARILKQFCSYSNLAGNSLNDISNFLKNSSLAQETHAIEELLAQATTNHNLA